MSLLLLFQGTPGTPIPAANYRNILHAGKRSKILKAQERNKTLMAKKRIKTL